LQKVMAMSHSSALAQQTELFPDLVEDEEEIRLSCWIDGLITAAAVGPRGVTMAEWMACVWRVIDDAPEAADLRAPFETTLSTMWSQTVGFMRTEPSWYMPTFMDLDDQLRGAKIWAEGFRAAMSLRPAAWRALLADPENQGYVVSIVLLSLNDAELIRFMQSDRPLQLLDAAELRQELADEVIDAVVGIHRHFHGRHAPPTQAVGRNAPCPCGSGRKYKKCCMR
jgi:uncharacterized protein